MIQPTNEVQQLMRETQRRAHAEAHTVPAATALPTAYEVSCLPEGEDRCRFALTVEYRGVGRWAVCRIGHQCLSVDGTWSWESRPSEREDDWLERHRFDLVTALRLAREQAPLLTVNGFTVTDALRMAEQRAKAGG